MSSQLPVVGDDGVVIYRKQLVATGVSRSSATCANERCQQEYVPDVRDLVPQVMLRKGSSVMDDERGSVLEYLVSSPSGKVDLQGDRRLTSVCRVVAFWCVPRPRPRPRAHPPGNTRCTVRPSFGFVRDRRASYCDAHKLVRTAMRLLAVLGLWGGIIWKEDPGSSSHAPPGTGIKTMDL